MLFENFLVEVVQREPVLEVIADATSAFSAPQIVIDAFGTDPDGDRLEYHWEVGQDSLSIWSEAIRDEETGRQIGSRAVVVAFFPGSHKLRVAASDGAASTEREIALHFPIEPPLPAGGMVRLILPTNNQAYEIDAYEYPNAKGERPQSASFFQAARLCAAEGKRLWQPERVACRLSSRPDTELFFDRRFGCLRQPRSLWRALLQRAGFGFFPIQQRPSRTTRALRLVSQLRRRERRL